MSNENNNKKKYKNLSQFSHTNKGKTEMNKFLADGRRSGRKLKRRFNCVFFFFSSSNIRDGKRLKGRRKIVISVVFKELF